MDQDRVEGLKVKIGELKSKKNGWESSLKYAQKQIAEIDVEIKEQESLLATHTGLGISSEFISKLVEEELKRRRLNDERGNSEIKQNNGVPATESEQH